MKKIKLYKQTDSNSFREILVMKKFWREEGYLTRYKKRKDNQGYTIYDLFIGKKV